jgi:hypothetical protein
LYVYTSRKNRPKLFWRIESGSLGYECGLKSLDINGRAITLELFKNCRFRGAVPRSTPTDGEIGKFSATAYTRFQFEASDRKVALKKREVFPYTQDDVRNDGGEISIRDEH